MASKAYLEGASFGEAMYELAGKPDRTTVNQAALFNVAKRFAKMEGYRELDAGLDWVAGFSDGYMGRAASANQPALDSPGN